MPKSKSTELAAWREDHFGELEETLAVLKGIRDDPEASHKDRIEASKSISRMLSAMSPSRAGAKATPKVEHKPTLEEYEEIERRLES